MNYTNLALIGIGFLGILLHNLVQLDKLNRKNPGSANVISYLKMEIFSVCISVIVVITCCIIKQEITQLEAAGKWLGLAFIAIGYMGQSLLIWIMSKASKTIGKEDEHPN